MLGTLRRADAGPPNRKLATYIKIVSKILLSFSVACLENIPTMPEIAAIPKGLMV